MGCAIEDLLLALSDRATSRTGRSTPGLTNFGVLDQGRVAFGDLVPTAASMLGVASFGGGIFPTISTYRDTLMIALPFCAGDMDPGPIDACLRAMDEELG